MKKIIFNLMVYNDRLVLTTWCVILLGGLGASAQEIHFPPSGENQKCTIQQEVGPSSISIVYSRPNVTGPSSEDRKGKIWGQLVSYGDAPFPWRAGANERTIIEFAHDVIINGKLVKAGKYGFMIIVKEKEPWTVIFSRDYLAWGTFGYKKENDALRFDVEPEPCEFSEWLTYGFVNCLESSSDVFLEWEYRRIRFNVQIPNHVQLYIDQFRQALSGSPVFFYPENWQWAAEYCLKNDTNLEEALRWANMSMSPALGEAAYSRMLTKANILAKLNRQKEADELMDKAVQSTTASADAIDKYARSLLSGGRVERAFSIFTLNYEKNKSQKYVPALGLADYYKAINDRKKEEKFLVEAIASVPPNSQVPKMELRQRLEALRSTK